MGGYNKDIIELNMVSPHADYPRVNKTQWSRQSTCNETEFKAVAADIQSSLEAKTKGQDGLEAPRVTRAAFHSSATYRAAGGPTALGGPNGGWLLFAQELGFPENAGIDEVVSPLKVIMRKHPCITFADLVTFAGAIATEYAGGPAIAWIPGRRDALQPTPELAVATLLPDGSFNAAGVMFWGTNIGLSARDMVVFVGGGHTAGAANFENSGWNGSFTPDLDQWPTQAKNRWFTDLVNLDWEPSTVSLSRRLQYIPKAAPELIGENGGPIIRSASLAVVSA
jgi:catalase (peroxidase I)